MLWNIRCVEYRITWLKKPINLYNVFNGKLLFRVNIYWQLQSYLHCFLNLQLRLNNYKVLLPKGKREATEHHGGGEWEDLSICDIMEVGHDESKLPVEKKTALLYYSLWAVKDIILVLTINFYFYSAHPLLTQPTWMLL